MITDESITQIAQQLGMATEHIYDVFVAAQPTIAIIQLVCGIFVIGFMVLGYYSYKKYEWAPDVVIAVIMCGITAISIALISYDCARCYFLPEYSAIIKLMELTLGGI